MYDKHPTKKRPETAADFTRFMHQSACNDIYGPFSCPAQVKYKEIELYRQPPAIALEFGTTWDRFQYAVQGTVAAHRETEEPRDGYFREKQKSGEDPSLEDAKGIFVAAWEEQSADLEDKSEVEDLKKRGLLAIKTWRDQVGSHLRPDRLHTDLSVPMMPDADGDSWYLRGSLDMTARHDSEVDDKPHMRDAKTSAKAWNTDKILGLIQPVHYSILVQNSSVTEHVNPGKFVYDVMVKNKTKARVDEFEIQITDSMRQTHLQRVDLLRELKKSMFRKGVYPPNRESLTCSRKHCGYWELCEKEYGGRVRDGGDSKNKPVVDVKDALKSSIEEVTKKKKEMTDV